MTPRLRPATADDRAFLVDVYAGTRADELALTNWTDADKRAFVEQQFHAQDVYYREHYTTATFDVILDGDTPVGRLYVDRWEDEIRIMDVALLPAARGRGIGTAVLGELVEEADAAGKALSIHVEKGNPARSLYERVGFTEAADRGLSVLMRREPAGAAAS